MGWATSADAGTVFGDLPHVAGRFYDSRIESALTTLALSANTLYGVPFYVPTATTYTAIAAEVTTLSAAHSLRIGIYNDSTGTPGTLVLDAGTVSTATTGGKSIVISQALAAGWYWLAVVTDGTATVRALSQTNALPSMGFTSGTDTTFHVGFDVAFTFGALPSPFTGGGAVMTTAAPRLLLGV